MEFSWLILGVVFLTNLCWIGVMYALQQIDKNLPPRHSIIPGTNQKFLYMQDFYTMFWGDMIGVTLIANAFVHLAVNSHVALWEWIVFILITVVDGFRFMKMCLTQNHKPDQGFPEIGKVSWHGLSHLPYHGAGVAMALFAIWHIITGELRGSVMYVALVGGTIYVASFITDIKTGNFDPLKKVD